MSDEDDKTRIAQDTGRTGPGTQLSGIYELDERIASGGMGEVWRGHNIQTGDHVAIKIVLPEFARDQTILSLFRKEASILNHLSHDAVVRYHVFTIDAGIARPYLAMEFVNGPSLYDIMRRGPMPVEDARRLCHRLTSGLAAVHAAGAVHRDLSPDNVILLDGQVGHAKIIDFGIARSANVGGETLIGGKFAGKYNYVSPEQVGLFGGEVSEQSDIYSLGLVLAAALRGKPIDMSGSQVEVVEKRRVVPDLTEIDEEIRPILEAMLQPDPQDRPASMAEIARLTREETPSDYDEPASNRPTTLRDRVLGASSGSIPPGSSPPHGSAPPKPTSFVPHQPPAHLAQPRAAPRQAVAPPARSRPPRRGVGLAAAAVVTLAIVGGGGAYITGLFGPGAPAPPPVQPKIEKAPAAQLPKPDKAAGGEAVKAEPLPVTAPRPQADAGQSAAEQTKAEGTAGAAEPAHPRVDAAPAADATPVKEPQDTAASDTEAAGDRSAAVRVEAEEIARDAVTAEPAQPRSDATAAADATPAKEPRDTAAPDAEAASQPPKAELQPARPNAEADRPAAEQANAEETAHDAITVEPAQPPHPRDTAASAADATPVKEPDAAASDVKAASEAAKPIDVRSAEKPVTVNGPDARPEPAAGQTAEPKPPQDAKVEAVAKPEATQQGVEDDDEISVALNVPKPEVPPEPAPGSPAERISWLAGYSGGNCFYASATAATDKTTEIEGFGKAVEPFNVLETAFKSKFHLEPDISVRLIAPSQCEVTTFLRAMGASTAEKPTLRLDRTSIPDGAPISGTLETTGGLISNVLLIDHKGMAFDLDDRIVVQSGRASFSIPIGLGAADKAAGKAVPLVMIVITGPESIHAADFSRPKPATTALTDILGEIEGKKQRFSATAKYFSLGG